MEARSPPACPDTNSTAEEARPAQQHPGASNNSNSEGRECRGAASSLGGHSCSKDHTWPFRSTKAGAGRRSTSLWQDRYQVACGPGGGGVSHEQQQGVYSGGAWHPHLTFAPGRPASGRALPSTTGHQSTTQSIASLTVYKEKDEGEAEPTWRGPKRTPTR